jgi:Fe-S-cluster containining protein
MRSNPYLGNPLRVLRLTAPTDRKSITGRAQLRVYGEPIAVEVTVPAGPTPLAELLPVFQGLTNAVVDLAVARVEAGGRTVSCRKGCGACCRQVVPVAESEARSLARLVDALPEPQRTAVRERFTEAVSRLAAAGILEPLVRALSHGSEPVRELGLAYFKAGVPCPFLENESCSIYADRPLACREYLVTSPAANCANPTAESIQMVPLPGRLSRAVMAEDRSATAGGWVPLVLSLDWADDHPSLQRSSPAGDGAGNIQAAGLISRSHFDDFESCAATDGLSKHRRSQFVWPN